MNSTYVVACGHGLHDAFASPWLEERSGERPLASKVSAQGFRPLARAHLGAYVLLQFSWWAYLLASTGRCPGAVDGPRRGVGVFAFLLVLGVMRLERNFKKRTCMRLARERNMLLGVTHELKTPLPACSWGWIPLSGSSCPNGGQGRRAGQHAERRARFGSSRGTTCWSPPDCNAKPT